MVTSTHGITISQLVKHFAEWTAGIVETLGVVTIGVSALYIVTRLVLSRLRKEDTHDAYSKARLLLGRGILMGLEFLVAADIIHTVAVELTYQTLGVLALMVAIRTFLSFTLEVELTGKWPWQKKS